MNVVITGGTSGLGLELVQILSNKKKIKKIIVIGRNKQKLTNLKKILFIYCDLEKKKDVCNAINLINKKKLNINIFINNAASINVSYNKKKILMINAYSQIYLNLKLIKNIKILNRIKIINISSNRLVFPKNKELFKQKNFWYNYKLSKYFLLIYTIFLNVYYNSKVISICFNPGRISTNFGKDNLIIGKLIKYYLKFLGKNSKDVANNIIKIIFKKKNNNFYGFKFNSDDKLISQNLQKAKKLIQKILKTYNQKNLLKRQF